MIRSSETAAPELNISPEKVCYIITKARAFDAKVPPVEPAPGSNPSDDGERAILEDYKNDPTVLELYSAIEMLNEDEIVDLIALAWLGRGDFTIGEWPEARTLARQRHRPHSARYLLGMPALGDYLEDGLSAFGLSCLEFDAQHL
jgi:hypothetical protein